MENQNTHYVLAFDFGASSGRAILGALKDGKIEMKEIHRFSNDPVIVNGTMYWIHSGSSLRSSRELSKRKNMEPLTVWGLIHGAWILD